MSSEKRGKLRFLLPVLVLLVGALLTYWLLSTKAEPQREVKGPVVTPVAGIRVAPVEVQVMVDAAGTVLPARQVELRSQVSGLITTMNRNLKPGGFLQADEVILRVDPRDYEFAIARQEAELASAVFGLKDEQGRKAVAEKEWALLGKELETSAAGKELALRIPQLAQARARVDAAKSSLAAAQLNLERTALYAPFNALVSRESVDVGQLVTTQTAVATLTGTDQYWIQAAIPVNELALFDLPGLDERGGAVARISHRTGQTEIVKQGRVIRLLANMEQMGRMARVLIAVDDPLGLNSDEAELPLLLDAYVNVQITGKRFEQMYALPLHALREGNRLWLCNQDGELEIRTVTVKRKEKARVLIADGLAPDEMVITSRISTPLPGMKLKLLEEEGLPDSEMTGRDYE